LIEGLGNVVERASEVFDLGEVLKCSSAPGEVGPEFGDVVVGVRLGEVPKESNREVLVVGLVELGDTVLVKLAAASLKLAGGRRWRPVWIMSSSCADEDPR
jgi:hypothetical protein